MGFNWPFHQEHRFRRAVSFAPSLGCPLAGAFFSASGLPFPAFRVRRLSAAASGASVRSAALCLRRWNNITLHFPVWGYLLTCRGLLLAFVLIYVKHFGQCAGFACRASVSVLLLVLMSTPHGWPPKAPRRVCGRRGARNSRRGANSRIGCRREGARRLPRHGRPRIERKAPAVAPLLEEPR